MTVPALKYSHHTLVFYPLKKREIAERVALRSDENHPSSRYLRERQGGFVFLRWLKNNPGKNMYAVVGLFASVDRPHELVVIKKLKRIMQPFCAADEGDPWPPEMEISSLSDPLVRRRLPLHLDEMGPSPFVETLAFQVHRRGEPGSDPDSYGNFDATLFYKFYNGGTLRGLAERYRDAGRVVPEGFIWHLIAHLGRALAWLHTGRVPPRAADDKGEPGRPEDPAWDPIAHLDAHPANIFLHYPSDEEKKADPRLAQFTDSLPQIILGDFGHALQQSKDRGDLLMQRSLPDLREHATLRDKGDLGAAIYHMIDWCVRNPQRVVRMPYETRDLTDPILGHYSNTLLEWYRQFQTIIDANVSQAWYSRPFGVDRQARERFPSNEYTYGALLATADARVADYVGSEREEPVRWTQPQAPCMPYRSMRRHPALHRRDWGAVRADLVDRTRPELAEYGLACVKRGQAHLIGAGVPESALGTVQSDAPTGPRVPSPLPSTPSSDGLGNVQDVEEHGGHARRATIQPRRSRHAVPAQRTGYVPQPKRPDLGDWIRERRRLRDEMNWLLARKWREEKEKREKREGTREKEEEKEEEEKEGRERKRRKEGQRSEEDEEDYEQARERPRKKRLTIRK